MVDERPAAESETLDGLVHLEQFTAHGGRAAIARLRISTTTRWDGRPLQLEDGERLQHFCRRLREQHVSAQLELVNTRLELCIA